MLYEVITTYGDRTHKALQPSVEELYEAVLDTFKVQIGFIDAAVSRADGLHW